MSPLSSGCQTHTIAHSLRPNMHFAPQRKSKGVCIRSSCISEDENGSVSCARNTAQAWGPGDSLTPLSASITLNHCEAHKSCLGISPEKKVPLVIPNLSSHFLLAVLKKKVTSAWRQRCSAREDRNDCTKSLQNQQRSFSHSSWYECGDISVANQGP